MYMGIDTYVVGLLQAVPELLILLLGPLDLILLGRLAGLQDLDRGAVLVLWVGSIEDGY